MAHQSREPQTLDIAEDLITDPSLSRNASFSRLNARAPEFVPRLSLPVNHGGHRVENQHHQHQPVVHVIYQHPPPPPPVSPQFVVPSSSHGIYHHHHHNNHEYYEEDVNQATARPGPVREGLSDEVIHKITKQVEYYFSDANLATTEHLMRFITKDPDGFVPITVIASFKKIKALVHSNSLLAAALRTSSKLVVSEDGKKVRRQQPLTELDVEELQSRIVVAENLPDDHCYQRLMKIFSVVGSVKTIRTCYPQAPNGTAAATNRSSKLDMLFANKLHAFVEYESIEDAEKAVAELNDGRNWRNGLRVRLLSSCMVPPKQGPARGRKPGHEGDGNVEEENASTSGQTKVNHMDQDPSQSAETAHEHVVEEVVVLDRESGTAKRGKGRGRGGKGRGRGGPHLNINNNNHHVGGGHTIGTSPPPNELPTIVSRQPPGPRMPDGTRGFTIGRGKPLQLHSGQ